MTRINTQENSSFNKPAYTRLKPEYCVFPLVGFPWLEFKKESFRIARQARNLLGTYIQMFEMDVETETQIKFRITKPTGFLLFFLRGNIGFHRESDKTISQLQSPTYYFRYNPMSTLTTHLGKGKHSVLVIGFEKSWFTPPTSRDLKEFSPLLEMWSSKSPTPMVLQEKHITVEVRNALDRIRTTIVENMEDELDILKYVSKCLDLYHKQLTDRKSLQLHEDLVKGEMLKEYLAENFMFDEECRAERILKNLDWTAWSLRRVAKNTLGCSVGRYTTKLRMEKALELSKETDIMIREIAFKVGFSSATAFIRAFKKNVGLSPHEYRKSKRT